LSKKNDLVVGLVVPEGIFELMSWEVERGEEFDKADSGNPR
jgi:hypothetical protein